MIDQLEPVLRTRPASRGVYAAMQAADRGRAGLRRRRRTQLAAFLERRFLGGSAGDAAGHGRRAAHEPDRVAELAAAGLPVLVLHGVDDDAWPPAVQHEMARPARRAARGCLPDAAHSPAVENPAATAAALFEFWRARSHRTGRRAVGSASSARTPAGR